MCCTLRGSIGADLETFGEGSGMGGICSLLKLPHCIGIMRFIQYIGSLLGSGAKRMRAYWLGSDTVGSRAREMQVVCCSSCIIRE